MDNNIDEAEFKAAWPEIHEAAIERGWLGAARAAWQAALIVQARAGSAAPAAPTALLSEILALAENGMSHGLLADTECAEIVAKIKSFADCQSKPDHVCGWCRGEGRIRSGDGSGYEDDCHQCKGSGHLASASPVAMMEAIMANLLDRRGVFADVDDDIMEEIRAEMCSTIRALAAPAAAVQPSANVERAIEILQMIQREIPRTLGDLNMELLMEDISKAEKALLGKDAAATPEQSDTTKGQA